VAGELRKAVEEAGAVVKDLGGSGRTDAGVHALAQAAHLRLAKAVDPEPFRRAVNEVLPPDIHVLAMAPVSDKFHARHSAGSRSYLYQISRRRTALAKRFVWWVKRPLDPTRMAQGIMTGIGFLGAGAIIKEGWSVRGLTTAASIWITAAIGILVGIGFYYPAAISTLLTLGTLSAFRWIEARMPMQFYAHFVVRFDFDAILPEPEMRDLLGEHRFTLGSLSYRLDKDRRFFEYSMTIRTNHARNVEALCEHLRRLESVKEFRMSPTD